MERWLLHAELHLNLRKPKKGGKQYNENVLQDLLNWAWRGGEQSMKDKVAKAMNTWSKS
jgi:hypothetical protein